MALLTLVACRDHKRSEGARKSSLEIAIARDLTAKLAQPATAQCVTAAGLAKCEATLADGTKLPIEVKGEGAEWAWHVVGLVIDTTPIKAHIDATLGDLKISQQASCGPRIVYVEAGGRIGCKLSGGGMAFVRVAADGSTSLELELDPASATARGEPVTPQRDRELTTISKALENLEGESDGEEEVTTDGGVPSP
ncbi:MAG TPA: hypothetical protein VIV40_34775 [Kofleriaceae bacterium]